MSSYLEAIEKSRISVIIVSKVYPSSSWCLTELEKMIECNKDYGQIVIPVLYNVSMVDIWYQTQDSGEASAWPGTGSEVTLEMTKQWQTALMKVVTLEMDKQSWRPFNLRVPFHRSIPITGNTVLREVDNRPFHSSEFRCESDLVENIIDRILMILNNIYSSDDKDLVGVQKCIEEIEDLVQTGLTDVSIVGIWGMSGIGKTSIARVVYNRVQSQFEDSYFALNVREEYDKPDGLATFREQLLLKKLRDEHSNIGFTFIREKLGCRKVLIVFDDVTSLEQMKSVIEDVNCLGLGSLIIITTRDEQVLKDCGVDYSNMFEVEALCHHEALQLFSQYAFDEKRPTLGFNELSNKIVKYAKGIPLALKVLGSYLFKKTKTVWERTIDKLGEVSNENVQLKEASDVDIQKMLRMSYDELDDDVKNIFLDIACFLKGENKDFVIKFLDACGFFAEIGISILIDRCLITILNNQITMHDLLQEMGRLIIREESFEVPSKRSRLWCYEDIYGLLKNNEGSKAIEGICLDMSKMVDIHPNAGAFTKMNKLRFLKLYNSPRERNNINKLSVSCRLESILTNLRYICWHGYPLESLQLRPERLVALDLPHSNVKQLWTGSQNLVNLKSINLSHSENLLKCPDLSCTPNLESLILEGCISLLEICSSIQYLKNLAILNLSHCKNLHSLPIIPCNIAQLLLEETAIDELPIENSPGLVILNLDNCSSLKSLPSSIDKAKSLECLKLSGCSNLDRFSCNLGNLKALRLLKAEIVAEIVLSSIVYLRFLRELNLRECYIMKLPSSLGLLRSLECLLLGRNNFRSIPTSIVDLSTLSYLDLGYFERLQLLPELPCHLQYLSAHSCASLTGSSNLSVLFGTTSRNVRINFLNCSRLYPSVLFDIVENTLCQIQTALLRLPLSRARPSGCICFPGTEIPEWFAFQSMGSCINFKLSSDGHFGLVSFVVCAILNFQNHNDVGQGLVVGFDCKLGGKEGSVVMYYDVGPHCVDSDHIFVGYDLHTCSFDFDDSQYNDDENSIQIYVQDSNAKHIDGCQVKKCGLHLFYYREVGKQRGEGVEVEKELMFEKYLSTRDVGRLKRLVIPKKHAETYFPLDGSSDSREKGLLLSFEDESGKRWRFRYWYRNSSQCYVMTKGWNKYVKEKRLNAGDIILFERHRTDTQRLFIGWRRRDASGMGLQDGDTGCSGVTFDQANISGQYARCELDTSLGLNC